MFEECLYFNSNALARTVTRIWTEAYKPFNLSVSHAFMLRVVLAKPGLMPKELAKELSLSRSTVTRFLDSLEKRDLLERKITVLDAREIEIYPTKSAKKIHQQLDEVGLNLSKQMSDVIGPYNLTQTVSNLRKIQTTLE